MKIVYTKSVTKDVKKIKDKKVISKITLVIKNIKDSSNLGQLQSVKKLSGHPLAYRIRIGDYRLGFYYENNTIILMRFLKRSDIYKLFP
ncbi:MAG: type II toxin-antitoxin system RelE/ParE family toxin [Flavobacteriaceae bacterium]|nr:type II toxin-antitoxin system RelE/ParE family toxin [Flavobacteriaceae bacterium]